MFAEFAEGTIVARYAPGEFATLLGLRFGADRIQVNDRYRDSFDGQMLLRVWNGVWCSR